MFERSNVVFRETITDDLLDNIECSLAKFLLFGAVRLHIEQKQSPKNTTAFTHYMWFEKGQSQRPIFK